MGAINSFYSFPADGSYALPLTAAFIALSGAVNLVLIVRERRRKRD